jgi:hypothetical protein
MLRFNVLNLFKPAVSASCVLSGGSEDVLLDALLDALLDVLSDVLLDVSPILLAALSEP